MFDSNLRGPTPQIAGVRKGWNCERGKRCRSKWSEKERVLTCNDGSIGPVQAYRSSPQTYNSKGRAIRCVRKASGKVEFQVRAGTGPCYIRPESFNSDLRLAKRAGERSRCSASVGRSRHLWKIQIVNGTSSHCRVQKHDPGQAHAILRATLHLSLALLGDFVVYQFLIVFQLGNSFLQ